MDQKTNVSIPGTTQPSKLMALIALLTAFALPFILVKIFSNKPKINHNPSTTVESKSKITYKKPITTIAAKTKTHTTKTTKALKNLAKTATTKLKNKPSLVKTSTLKNNVQKIPPTTIPVQPDGWKVIKTQQGDSLATVFKRLRLSPQTLQAIIRKNPFAKTLSRLQPNQNLQLLIKNHTLEKMILPYTQMEQLAIVRQGHQYQTKILSKKITTQTHIVVATIRGSLYNTAKRNNIPYQLIQQMTKIFTWDINFATDIHMGDKFSILYEARYIEDKRVGTGNILAVKYKTRNKTFEAIHYTNRRGQSDYYSPKGTSLKKAFERYPLYFSHISSTFSLSRYHPILHYRRPHRGVDLAAPIGTPIRATGDGRVETIGRQSGYGNMIKIKHNKTYSTIYGHMLKFQKGLYRGSFVKRGQVIGYVGQTGLASGPHCHYEFHINRQPKNPTTVNLPRGFPIEGREMASFKANAMRLLAKLNVFEKTQLAKR